MNPPRLIVAIELEEHAHAVRLVNVDDAGDALRLSAWLRRPRTRRRILAEIETMLERVASWKLVDQERAA